MLAQHDGEGEQAAVMQDAEFTMRGQTLAATEADVKRMRDLYLEMVRKGLTHTLYWPLDHAALDKVTTDDAKKKAYRQALKDKKWNMVKGREEGRDQPSWAQTMVGLRRLENVQACVERVLTDDVPGDFIETGVWRGGVVIMMRAVLHAYGDKTRWVVAADSFKGLPPPNARLYPADAGDTHHMSPHLAITRSVVERNISLYGLLERVEFLEGWFSETLPTMHKRTWSIVRLDGDMYESTMDGLVNLYPGLSVGGFLIIDDYAHPACQRAISDYRQMHGIDDEIVEVDWTGAYWRRTRN